MSVRYDLRTCPLPLRQHSRLHLLTRPSAGLAVTFPGTAIANVLLLVQ